MTGLITNPKVVQDALQSKKSSIAEPSDYGKKKTKAKNSKKPKSKDESKPLSNAGSKKNSPANSQPKSSQPTAGDSSTEDLRRALFPDLYPSANSSNGGSGRATPKKSGKNSNSTSNPHTPKNKDKEKDRSTTKAISPLQSAGNCFAGSSFSSSPAASSLPKPSFKGKSTSSPEQQNANPQQSPIFPSPSTHHSTFGFPGGPGYGYPGPPPAHAGGAGNPIFMNQQQPMAGGGYGYYPPVPMPPTNGYYSSVPMAGNSGYSAVAVPQQAPVTAPGPSLFNHFMMSDRLEKQSRGVQP